MAVAKKAIIWPIVIEDDGAVVQQKFKVHAKIMTSIDIKICNILD